MTRQAAIATAILALCASLTGACAVEPEPEESLGAGCNGKCDDLLGRELEVYPRMPARAIELGTFWVKPTVKERGNTVAITTDDLRMDATALLEGTGDSYLAINVYDSVLNPFGIVLEGRGDDGRWYRVPAKPGDPTWFWANISITPHVEREFTLSGVAVRADEWLGRSDSETVKVGPLFVPVSMRDLRILVVPLADPLDWDETGYNAYVTVWDRPSA